MAGRPLPYAPSQPSPPEDTRGVRRRPGSDSTGRVRARSRPVLPRNRATAPGIVSSNRDCFQVILDGLDDVPGQGQVRLFRLPVLMKQGDGFMRGIQDELFRQQGFGCEMGEFVF